MSSKKNRLPLISIFSSIYKGGEYIEHYLEDIACQTIFDKAELILVDGNSPDGEGEIISRFQKKHKNVIYVREKEDPGLYACWNIAAKISKGKYLNNANLDDSKYPTALEEQVNLLESNPGVDLVYTDSLITDRPNQSYDNVQPVSRYHFPPFSLPNLLRFNMPHQSPVYRRTLHERFGFFEEKYRSAADSEFWLRCATGGAKMEKLDKVLGIYYHNPKGVSTNPDHDEWKCKEESEVKSKYSTIIKEMI